jgi:hypothetical protein
MGFLTHPALLTVGGEYRFTGLSDHQSNPALFVGDEAGFAGAAPAASHFAPPAIHCFTRDISESDSGADGGMLRVDTLLKRRLLSGLPATRAGPPAPPRLREAAELISSPPDGDLPEWQVRQRVFRRRATAADWLSACCPRAGAAVRARPITAAI